MPLTPVDYSKTIIYKIEHNVDKSLVYIGSTTDFKSRKREHKSVCYNEKSNRYNLKLYVMMRDNGGWNEFQMLEIKKYPCNDGNEARAEEERCRVELKATLNSCRAFRSKEEYLEYKTLYRNEHREQQKLYREENKDKIREKDKEWREANKDKIREKDRIRSKEYREANKDKSKAYREANKDKSKEYNKAYYEKKRAILKSNLIQ